MRRRKQIALCVLLTLFPLSARAGGARQGRWEAGTSPVYSYIVLEGQGEPDGGGAGAYVRYRLEEGFYLQLSTLWTAHQVEAEGESSTYQLLNFSAGVGYAIDLARFVPTLEAGVGLLHRRFGDQAANDLGIRVGLGIDYQLLDWLLLGVALHYHAFLSDPTNIPIYVEMGPRVTFRWGR